MATANPAAGQMILSKYKIGKAKNTGEMAEMLTHAIVNGKATPVLTEILGAAPMPKAGYDGCTGCGGGCSGADGESNGGTSEAAMADPEKGNFLDIYGKQLFIASLGLLAGLLLAKSMGK